MTLIGLDVGTTGCKAALYTDDGILLARASREYAIDIPQPMWAEQDAEQVWTLIQAVLRELVEGRKVSGALALSVQGEAVIPVDKHGYALRPAILGMDTRTDEQNEWLRGRIGARHLFDLTGMPVHTINTLPKLLWLRQHEPHLWEQVARFSLYEDFLIAKMTGNAVISDCLASRTQLFDTKSGVWSAQILASLELESSRLPEIYPSGTFAGTMRRDLSEALGFVEPPSVFTGGHDQACGALGVGLVRPGLAMVSTGTAEVVEVTLQTPTLNDTLYAGNISVYRHTYPGLYVAMTLNHSGGLLLRWFRDTFGSEELSQGRRQNRDAYDILLENASPEPTSLLVLPHFAGSGTPTFDTLSKGAILGLTFSTGKADVAKALLEGLTFELKVNLDVMKRGQVPISELRAIGGGARSRLWTQLKADITGLPVAVPRSIDAACWGAALIAGAASGVFGDLGEASTRLTVIDQRFEPDVRRTQSYAERYALYQDVYPALIPILRRM